MPREIELKLALGGDAAIALTRHPVLGGRPGRPTTLANTYYDTPDGALRAARVALRIRHTPQRRLQTLKTAGHGSGGLSTRGEWEWEIDTADLDLAGLAALAPMQALGEDVLDALVPRFTTDFERHIWLIERDDACIELAHDRGEIRAGERRVAIDELELELKSGGGRSGSPASLWQLATELAERVPLRPANASKAARGAALLDRRWTLSSHGPACFDRAIDALDALTDSGDPTFRTQARESFAAIADASPHAAVSEHASALAAALATPNWLDIAFGRQCLALRSALLTHASSR